MMDARRSGLSEARAWAIVGGVLALIAAGVGMLVRQAEQSLALALAAQRDRDAPLIEVRRLPYDGPPVIIPAPSPAPAPDARADDQGRLIRNPAWAVRPAGEYPQAAARAGVTSGEATLKCEALSDGRVGACVVVRESPEGYGFAAAAEAGARGARLHPRQIDGFSTDSSVQFTTRFRVE